jgi:uncharacterized protein
VPAPDVDLDSAPFWHQLREHHLVVQHCTVCDHRWLPRTPACPYCGATELDDIISAGHGVVYSFVRAHRAMSDAMAAEAPYTIATVDIDVGGRVFARIDGDCAIGDAVTATFVDHGEWTELRFRR